jgi:hypothetical protein
LSAFSSLQTAQIVNLTTHQMGAIAPTQLARLSTAQLQAFLGGASATAAFSAIPASTLTAAQWNALNS